MAVDCTAEEFDALVMHVLDSLPSPFAETLDDVAVVCADDPPEPHLYGLYEGPGYGGPVLPMPTVITIFQSTLCADAKDMDDLREQVRITVLHEIGHHLGMDEEGLTAAGYA